MTDDEALRTLIDAIKEFEGCSLVAYKCPAGVWTIGYGETEGVREGDVWTWKKAEDNLTKNVPRFVSFILKVCPILHLEPPQRWAACASLAYNIGAGAFRRSTVCKKTNLGDFIGAADAFLLWNKSKGRVLKGLTARRRRERSLYLS